MKLLRHGLLSLALAALSAGAAQAQKVQINGAGATFPYPIYSKWFSEYNKLHPDIEINYQSIGSGGGIRQLSQGTVFFGATDGPMTDEQLQGALGKVLHLPTVLGGVVPIYNLPGVSSDLKFTGQVIADIILGKITKWNDSALTALNPGVNLPGTDITVAHRSDGSGTTYIFVDYLSKVVPEFKHKVGIATSVNWPVGVGAKGNEGVAGVVKQTPGAFGYVELDLRTPEQDRLRLGEELGGRIRPVEPRVRLRRGSRRGQRDARGLPGLDYERARQGRLPDLVVYVAALV